MSTPTHAVHRSELTPYEAEQVRRIAAWKSEPPHSLGELWKRATLPAAHAIERAIPHRVVRAAITRAYDASEVLAGEEDVKRRARISDLADLRQGPLERCDRLAVAIGSAAEGLAAVEGAATGAGGLFTTFLDVPLLFVLGLRTIRKIGHCYGYPLARHQDRHFVLGVMTVAMAASLDIRRERIHRLRELEELLIEETQEDVLTEEALSVLFQLEIFGEIPGVGAISGGVLNWHYMRRVVETARMLFQERWMRDNDKLTYVDPAEVHPRHLASGWSGTLNRVAYSGCYGLGFGLALPVYAVASLLRPMDNALTRGLRDGAAAALERSGGFVERTRGLSHPARIIGEDAP